MATLTKKHHWTKPYTPVSQVSKPVATSLRTKILKQRAESMGECQLTVSKEWTIPSSPFMNTPVTIHERENIFENIGAHIQYNSAREGIENVSKHLQKHAGESAKAFQAAQAFFEQAAVAAKSLHFEESAIEYWNKALASKECARMANTLATLENLVAGSFLLDAEKMGTQCKLAEILQKATSSDMTTKSS